jgi:hypothetical protein
MCNTYCFSTATMVARKRLNVMSYVHYLSCCQCRRSKGAICNGIVNLWHNLVSYGERYFGCTDAKNAMAAWEALNVYMNLATNSVFSLLLQKNHREFLSKWLFSGLSQLTLTSGHSSTFHYAKNSDSACMCFVFVAACTDHRDIRI